MSPRRIAKRYLPDPHAIANNPRLKLLHPIMAVPGIWHFGRRSVAGGFSLGLFLAFVPIPVQQILSIPFSILFRVNLPAALAAVWISNPLTFAPIFYFAYQVGLKVTGATPKPFRLDFSLSGIGHSLSGIAEPLIVGCLVCAVVSAVAGNVLVRVVWRVLLVARMRERRARHVELARTRVSGER